MADCVFRYRSQEIHFGVKYVTQKAKKYADFLLVGLCKNYLQLILGIKVRKVDEVIFSFCFTIHCMSECNYD